MWFIVALLVCVPFLLKVHSDLSKERAYDQRHLENELACAASLKRWVDRVTDRKLEMELEEIIRYASYALPARDTTESELSDDLKRNLRCYKTVFSDMKKAHDEMPWMGKVRSRYDFDPNSLDVRGFFVSWDEHEQYEILRIMMACRGKLTDHDAHLGICVGAPIGTTQKQTLKNLEHKRDFVIWIDKQLKEHGINEDLYYYFGHYYTLEASVHRIGGNFVWKPMMNPELEIETTRLPTADWFREEDDTPSTAD